MLWDDDSHLTRYALRSLHGLWRIWFHLGDTAQYYPLLHSAFWLESYLWAARCWASIWGTSCSMQYRLTWWCSCPPLGIARGMARGPGFRAASGLRGIGGVAFGAEVHTFGCLLPALTYLHFYATRRRRHYLVALRFFVLALLSKSVTATLPAVLLVILWWRNGRLDWKRDVRPLIGRLVLGRARAGSPPGWKEPMWKRRAPPGS
jgi:protein O-mannosyl-transferase